MPDNNIRSLSALKVASFLAIAVMSTWILIVGKSILQPFIVAMFLFFFITSLSNIFSKFHIRGKYLPFGLPTLFSVIVIFGAILILVSVMVSVSASELISKWENYKDIVIKTVGDLDNWTGLQIQKITGRDFDINSIGPIIKALNSIDVSAWASLFQQALSNAASFIGMTIFYLIFLLLEQRIFHKKLEALFPDKQRLMHVNEILLRIRRGVFSYLQVKTFISLLTGIITYIILRIFHVDFAEFWAVLTFILNYIPSIGSLIAVALTCIAALVQFSPVKVGGLFLCLTAIQQFLGGYLDPKMNSDRLNLSPLVIIFALIFWGKIWGVLGAFFCVPLTAILNIILANFRTTRPIAILLSSKGYIFNGKTKEK